MQRIFSTSFSLLTFATGFALVVLFVCSLPAGVAGQINYVPNPSFEELTDCDLNYGDVPKASPWQIVNSPATDPDLYNYCSTSGFYRPPAGCGELEPKDGEGFMGQVSLVTEERVYARLLDTLPTDIDIYVAFSIAARGRCSTGTSFACNANTQCLAFSDYAFQNEVLVLYPDSVLTRTDAWTTLGTCYRASGQEDYILLGNYLSYVNIRMECDTIDPLNYSYNFVDEVIVSPFDVVPDTFHLCGDETLDLDISFYDVPIYWSDGYHGGSRTITEGGRYIVYGDLDGCDLADETVVIHIPDEAQMIEETLCAGNELVLHTPFPAIWPTGDTTTTLRVTTPGTYAAQLLGDCGERSWTYLVTEADCSFQYYVPNVFSPNDDGINDQLEFFFQSDYAFTGDLRIFDRWGNLMFSMEDVQPGQTVRWKGQSRGQPLNPGVFVWSFRYVSELGGEEKVISGDVALLR
ncbi:MAG: gliding motility-associated C-terminal domain-containing protein [Lewinella sp.]|nr:gliding motility-associated C-terminal domain-containing protein [Lewinella sp.]